VEGVAAGGLVLAGLYWEGSERGPMWLGSE
jgi:hypothetical protein